MAKFQVRARAVDMLGRQQIAGVPTALHELFKNAHDAYAERCEADFFRGQRTLILRDDGYGMTLEEFQARWLALGTDSRLKANDQNEVHWTGPRNADRRPIMGEKGIGRLAIGTIAPLTLIMTRAVRPGEDGLVFHELVTSLVCWQLFEIPGIDVSEIDIPIETISEGRLPSADVIQSMVARVRENLKALSVPTNKGIGKEITENLDFAEIDPAAIDAGLRSVLEEDFDDSLSLVGTGYGTHFVLFPTDEGLETDIDQSSKSTRFKTTVYTAPPLRKILLGFSNTVLPNTEPRLSVQFRDHRQNGVTNEIIGPKEFFTPEEYKIADHHIEGSFDEFGHFSGSVSVFNTEREPYELSWPETKGPSACGPFRIHIGYVPGSAWESSLAQTTYDNLSAKLNSLGGIYIYKDGIRVLPYGTTDTDFLNIERRRTMSASDWFFSYRRMIGVIEVSHLQNPGLMEKAGREGFRENKAFREFRAILEHFFQSLAMDFFRKTGERSSVYDAEKKRRETDFQLLKKREKNTRIKKQKFEDALDELFERLETGKHRHALATVKSDLNRAIEHLETLTQNEFSRVAFSMEEELHEALDTQEQKLSLSKPRGLAFSKKVEASYATLGDIIAQFRTKEILPLRKEIASRFSELRREMGVVQERQRRALEHIQSEGNASRATLREMRTKTEASLASLDKVIRSSLREQAAELGNTVELISKEISRNPIDELSDEEAFDVQRRWEERIESSLEQQKETLSALQDQLASLVEAVANGETLDATTAALERKVQELSEQLSTYSDFAQAGMAVGIIGHEMDNVIDGIRIQLSALAPWARGTPEIKDIHDALRGYFQELDGHLELFDPLSRRSRRANTPLHGNIIEKYVNEAFHARLNEQKVELQVTEKFRSQSLSGFHSAFLAAIINIVDNALFWISFDPKSERWIRLDATEGGIAISNGGPPVPLRMVDRIFEFGVSTKPGGRGMGLAISREALRRIGHDLYLSEPYKQSSPKFIIEPIEINDDDD